jgi:hypothetical protein
MSRAPEGLDIDEWVRDVIVGWEFKYKSNLANMVIYGNQISSNKIKDQTALLTRHAIR